MCVCVHAYAGACMRESIAAENVGKQTQAHNEIAVLEEINMLIDFLKCLSSVLCSTSGQNARKWLTSLTVGQSSVAVDTF